MARAQKAAAMEKTYNGGWVTGECAVFHTILGQVGPGEMPRVEQV